MSKDKAIDITEFNTVKSSEEGSPMDLMFGGKPTGIQLIVLGEHSDTVQMFETEKAKKMARKSSIAEKRKQSLEFLLELLESSKERDIESAMARVSGWIGGGEFDKEKLRRGLENNPQWIIQIHDFSKDETNFTTAS